MKITKLNHIEYFPDSLRHSLREIGQYVEYDDVPSVQEAARRLAETDIAIVEWSVTVDRSMLEAIPRRLKHIIAPLADYSHIDCEAAKEMGITVANCPGATTIAVAEHLFALLGAVNRQILMADRLVREGKRDYYGPFMHVELKGKTLGILGLGDIGAYAAAIARGFNMQVIAHNRSPKALPGVNMVDMETLLKGVCPEEVFNALFSFLGPFFPCIAVFALRKEEFCGWLIRGFPLRTSEFSKVRAKVAPGILHKLRG